MITLIHPHHHPISSESNKEFKGFYFFLVKAFQFFSFQQEKCSHNFISIFTTTNYKKFFVSQGERNKASRNNQMRFSIVVPKIQNSF